jgi:hypothetical protein
MRDGIEYEFTTVFDIDLSHQAATSKDRTGLFTDKVFQVTEETGQQIAGWLTATGGQSTATAQPSPAAKPVPASPPADSGKPATDQQIKNIEALWQRLGYGQAQMQKLFQWLDAEALKGAEHWTDLTQEQAARAIGFLSKKASEGGAA